MHCPKCNHGNSKVIESRDVGVTSAIRRRRECLSCQHRFTTYERIELPNLVVIKRDGTREMFNRNKLLAGLSRAFEKRLTSSVKLEEIVATIERNLRSAGESEVRTSDLGESILRELAKIDEVAYVRFASVYRSFKDVASFEKELARLKNGS